jgi:pimeloyl-ACP methyl ester carboxylesterase
MHPLESVAPSARQAVPVIVALHSSGAGARQWEPYRASLGAASRFIPIDLLGYDSPAGWPVGAPVSLEDEARRVAPALAWGEEGVHLVGHSYGGAVALQVALRWPERVRSLTLFEPVRFALLRGRDEVSWQDVTGAGHRIAALAKAGDLPASGEAFVDYWSGKGAWGRLSAGQRAAITWRMPKVGAEFQALFADAVPLAAYAALSMPVRLLTGTRSPACARRIVAILSGALPRAEVVSLPGLGHLGPITDPARVMAAMGRPGNAPLAIAA